jgi:hypothetical protein
MTSFYMTLAHNDVSGERQEAYQLVPVAARDADPAFWGWPGAYSAGGSGPELSISLDDLGVSSTARVYYFDGRDEFRFCAEQVYRGGVAAGSILEIEKTGPGSYRTTVYATGDPSYAAASAVASIPVTAPSSAKRWGYA